VSFDLAGNGMVGLTRDAFTTLRSVLFRETGANAATYLQEAGYAGGDALHQAFGKWCEARDLGVPENMAAREFELRAAEFFWELGWGVVTVGTVRDSVLMLDSPDWAESDPASAMQYPGCYLSAGLLSDFFGRIAGAQLVAMEVECRSMGSERCRFLVGSAETMQHVYDGITQGIAYDASLEQMT
jgi:predicted hydrocarbon binding protein